MHGLRNLLALPATLLVLIASSAVDAHELEGPYNLPRTSKFHPEHDQILRRELEAREQSRWQEPVGMRKMSDDEGEKFFLHYWNFGEREDHRLWTNASMAQYKPFAYHSDQKRSPIRLWGRSIFERDFDCPQDTQSCASIGQPNSCCSTGDTCITVTDTGNGGVGCCPQGQTCGTTISGCDANQGYTSCPDSSNGGCCIPGYACYDVGCVLTAKETVWTTLPVATVTGGQSSSSENSPSATSFPSTIVVATSINPSGETTTVTVTETPGATTVLAPTTILVTPSSSQTPTPSSQTTSSASSSTEAAAPVRPTSDSTVSAAEVSSTSPTPSTTAIYSSCPTGFYMCSAYYMGGCCRVGRNCDTTSCPSSASTAVVTSGQTVVVPAGGSAASTTAAGGGGGGGETGAASGSGSQGSCANGWYGCDASAGGGCCPSGYICGQSCMPTISGVANQPKEAPSSANMLRWAWGFMGIGIATGVGMVWL